MAKAVKDAANDKTIKAIVMRVDSPGGSGLASDIIWHAVDEARQKKPVVISMSDVAASGGYYIAASANKIVAEPSTITGSIGVVAGKPVVKGLYDWLGITNEYVLRGKNAGMFRETEKFNDDERAKFEGWIKTTYYEDFVPKVAKGRNKSAEYIDSIGQGRVWTGAQGRIMDSSTNMAVWIAPSRSRKSWPKFPPTKASIASSFPYPQTFLQELLNSSDDEASETAETPQLRQQRAVLASLPEDARRAFRYAMLLDKMKDGDAMLLMPFDLRVK